MLLYIINLISILFYSLIYHTFNNKHKFKKYFVAFISFQLITVLSLRHYTIGVDVLRYMAHFRNFAQLELHQLVTHRFEIGYILLNKVIGSITLNEQVFLMIIATITIIPVGRFIYKHSKMPFLSFGLYIAFNFYTFIFSGLRQGIAYGIVLLSYDFIVSRKLRNFVVCILFAALFHNSALIFLPAYFLVKVKINKRSIGFIIMINSIMFILRRQLFVFVTNHIYSGYELVESNSISWMLLGVLIIFLGLLFYKKVISVSAESNYLYILVIIGVSLMIFATVGTNVMRTTNYYYMYIIVFIPEVLNSFKNKKLLILVAYLVVIFIFFLHIWFLIQSNTYQVVPYKFFWE